MRASTSSFTAASPLRTASRRPRRGDHNVPVFAMRGRIQTVWSSVTGVVPIHRQSDTMTCVAPIGGRRLKASGTGSLMPPSVRRYRP
jgi:hypothetical protein